ncbi:MAG: pentapeptide repeat-containing protein [Alphaproteobacteria bacterium]|nr:pentapeptide repeat-containing protein [Alphaproteobacteria bacterium]
MSAPAPPPPDQDTSDQMPQKLWLALARLGVETWNEWMKGTEQARQEIEDTSLIRAGRKWRKLTDDEALPIIEAALAKNTRLSDILHKSEHFGLESSDEAARLALFKPVNLSSVDFRRTENEAIRFRGAQFGFAANLSGAQFGVWANLSGAQFGFAANLSGAQFGHEADLSGARFSYSANLSGAQFGDGADLSGAQFGDDANLSCAKFGNFADLSGAQFGERANLSGAWFGFRAGLSSARFGDSANLSGAQFDLRANLSGAKFGNLADLSGARFGNGADLSGARFGDYADFSGTIFLGFARFNSAEFHNCQFRGWTESEWKQFVENMRRENPTGNDAWEKEIMRREDSESYRTLPDMDFTGARFNGTINFSGRKLNGALSFRDAVFKQPPEFGDAENLHRIDMVGTTFRARDPAKDLPWFIPKGMRIDWTKDSLKLTRIRRLRAIMETNAAHDTARDLFVLEKHAERGAFHASGRHGALIASSFMLGIYWLLSDCGRSVMRPMLWLGAVILGFAAFYDSKNIAMFDHWGVLWALSLVAVYVPFVRRPPFTRGKWSWENRIATMIVLLTVGGIAIHGAGQFPPSPLIAHDVENAKKAEALIDFALLNSVPIAGPAGESYKTVTKNLGLRDFDGDLDLPFGMRLWVLSQQIVSGVLLFLIGLGLRNRFRIG